MNTTFERYVKINKHLRYHDIAQIDALPFFQCLEHGYDFLMNKLKALDTIVVDFCERIFQMYQMQYYFDIAIVRFSKLKSQLGANSDIVQSSAFESTADKIQMNHYRALT